MAQSPPYLHPFACFSCRRSFKRPAGRRDEATCPNCGNPAVRLSRKFKPPRQENVEHWETVERLVKLGFRFDTIPDGNGGTLRYPVTERGIPAFLERVTERSAQLTKKRRSGGKSDARREAGPLKTRRANKTRRLKKS